MMIEVVMHPFTIKNIKVFLANDFISIPKSASIDGLMRYVRYTTKNKEMTNHPQMYKLNV